MESGQTIHNNVFDFHAALSGNERRNNIFVLIVRQFRLLLTSHYI